MARTFLTAEWRDLAIVSYPVDAALLRPRLPPGLELDLFDGSAVCSLVGFRFENTRVFGVRWPGFTRFPEINLRFYVREPGSGRRGVVFVRELVASALIAGIARAVYNEPYVRTPVRDRVQRSADGVRVEYRFGRPSAAGSMIVDASAEASVPPESSAEQWFKEHSWGYGVTRRGRTLRYEVRHPVWACHAVRSARVDVDFASVYGPEWRALAETQPISTVLAVGSEVAVFAGDPLG
jgi:uncharacterized protein YqjF (DUF2071 family)